jgi:hypothetical protein
MFVDIPNFNVTAICALGVRQLKSFLWWIKIQLFLGVPRRQTGECRHNFGEGSATFVSLFKGVQRMRNSQICCSRLLKTLHNFLVEYRPRRSRVEEGAVRIKTKNLITLEIPLQSPLFLQPTFKRVKTASIQIIMFLIRFHLSFFLI